MRSRTIDHGHPAEGGRWSVKMSSLSMETAVESFLKLRMTSASRQVVLLEYEILYPVVMMGWESYLSLEATKSINGTEKSTPPKRHFQEVPRTLVQVSSTVVGVRVRHQDLIPSIVPLRRDYQSFETATSMVLIKTPTSSSPGTSCPNGSALC